MVPQRTRGSASLIRTLFLIVLCFLVFVPHTCAQSQIQVEATGPVRKLKTRISPEYPELALKARMSGTARVELIVTIDGSVKQVKEIGGNPVLLAALVRAVKQWKYEPAPTESVMEVKAAFSAFSQ